MNDFKFISYTPTPTDQYMLGIAKIKAYGKIEINFKHVKTKDGTGDFFCSGNYTHEVNGEKKYVPCFLIDSRSDEHELLDFIRHSVNQVIHQRSAVKAQVANSQPAGAMYYPHGLVQPQPAPTSMSEVAMQEQLPF